MTRHTALVLLALVACIVRGGTELHGQDTVTVNVIDPDAPPPEESYRAGAAARALEEAVGRYNDSTVTRLYGSFTVGPGTWIQGDVAMFRGTLRILGRVTGRVTLLNGTLTVGPGGQLDGEVLLLGGRYQVQAGGRHTGGLRTYADPAPVYRTAAGLLEKRDRPPTLADLARAQASFRAGRLQTTLSVETGRTYNRVEGLPLRVGPVFSIPTVGGGEVRLDLQAIIRTVTDPSDQRSPFGYQARLEYRQEEPLRFGVGLDVTRQVEANESHPLSRSEVGWGTFLFGRDYRDYHETEGIGASAWLSPVPRLRLHASLRYQEEATIPSADPVSIFRDPDPWRPNPLIDDGHYTLVGVGIELDTRNNPVTPTSGWLLRANLERGRSADVAPVALPVDVREPIPTFRNYQFTHGSFDLRAYARLNANVRVNARAVGAGWIGGDGLPVQRRVSIGGPDLLPGHRFRSTRCAPPTLGDPAMGALCDRMAAFQLETRYRFRLGLRERLGEQEWLVLERLLGTDQADIVLFGNAGNAWLTGDGPNRVPTNRLPVPGEWSYDAGFGFDFDGLALFLGSSTRKLEPRLTLRLQRRF